METILVLVLLLLVAVSCSSNSNSSSSSSSSGVNKNDSRSLCNQYSRVCGPNGNCDETQTCMCLDGFTPKSPNEFAYMNSRQGCVRNKPLNCNTDVFVRYSSLKDPSGGYSLPNQEDCMAKCKSNCSCMAYKVVLGGGCKLWNGDLFDAVLVKQGGQDFYIRMPASEEQGISTEQGRNKGVVVGIVLGSIVVVISMIIASCYMLRKRRPSKALEHVRIEEIVTHHTNIQKEDMGLPLFDLSRIAMATNNFSPNNKLGEGGFGPVYKGILDDGQEIAVKRLSSSSGQGLNEFKTEVKLIAKLQHRNLVKLFGCCIQQEEKLLIYEYMPNKSLDYFIFDHERRSALDWSKRFNIIRGIAKGLLYLHQDSRLRIIHRDLKTSNILLDTKMEPKISDFGLARSFGSNESKANTKKVVGTL
ncbi:hypothetical protein PIB30_003482 [Stylosanthes scabra]|uniref:Uncharacterized protein n=1 Tax=Stylosanthes scabra TaxID=79078 RepID=A0ABU6V4S4_9FABA|nr:hypothetical protein [Stylosanthes scabra]